MTQDKGLLQVVHRLARDEGFRDRFMVTPVDTMLDELGISRETYQTLKTLVPVLLAGGMFALAGDLPAGAEDLIVEPEIDWGYQYPSP